MLQYTNIIYYVLHIILLRTFECVSAYNTSEYLRLAVDQLKCSVHSHDSICINACS